ncbi:TIR domain-containing protein [Vibrio sp. SCSIO 43132]|uniref:COR domain-containing protein n=1 Tax=Vibrio sp. SCSIO 43132 TaxID=2779363 RepID=UPI001CAA3D60|nr:COR domain-containing protein [Vibrio sp. SCSIO 43132]UAB73490.1 TIR domain-containing protein [Vibrio sp. SCSIO 43132]
MSSFEHPGAQREAIRLINEALESGGTHLDLSGLRLRKIPEEIEKLSATLTSLDLSRCVNITSLTGVEKLTQLTSLKANFCRNLKSLAGVEKLEKINLLSLRYCSALSSLEEIEDLLSLTSLSLENSDLLTDLNVIKNLNQLKVLNIDHCSSLKSFDGVQGLICLSELSARRCGELTSLSGIEHLLNLESMDLSGCRNLSNLYGIESLGKLHNLNLTSCQGLTSLAEISDLNSLEVLDCCGLDFITDLTFTRGMERLTTLDISACANLTNLSGLEKHKHLEYLGLRNCELLTDLSVLKELKQLKHLDVSGCKNLVSLSGIEQLNLITELELRDCQGLTSLEEIKGLTHLTKLNISDCTNIVSLFGIETLSTLTDLNANNCDTLTTLSGIEGLTQLKALSICDCTGVTSLSGIEGLDKLEHLDVSWCPQLVDLDSIEGLKQIKTLEISEAIDFGQLEQLKTLALYGIANITNFLCLRSNTQLTNLVVSRCESFVDLQGIEFLEHLERLYITDCTNLSNLSNITELHQLSNFSIGACDKVALPWNIGKRLLLDAPRLEVWGSLPIEHIPSELTEHFDQTAIENWLHDVKTGGKCTANSMKVMLLGNGRIGKTQLARRLRGKGFDSSIPSTHGIQIDRYTNDNGTQINTWDFGGQDVYLSTHSLFIDRRALYLVLWHPDHENTNLVSCEQLNIRNKPLSYWLAYLNSLVGENANIIVCQAQCDFPEQEQSEPIPHPNPFLRLKRTPISTIAEDGLDIFSPLFSRSIQYQLDKNGETWLPQSWMKVEQEIREKYECGEKRLSFSSFEAMCESAGVSAPSSFAQYLHQSGAVFYSEGHFDNDLILDQEWALEGVYLLLERDNALPALKANWGKFTKETISPLLWDESNSVAQTGLFIDMMEQCGVCFEVANNQYISPDALPEKSVVERHISQIWQYSEPDVHVQLEYEFLHDATQRVLLSKIGSIAKSEACYWRYGCCYFDSKHHVKVSFECVEVAEQERNQQQIQSYSRPGYIDITLSGKGSNSLAKHLVQSIQETNHLGKSPNVRWLLGTQQQDKDSQYQSKMEPFSDMGEATAVQKPKIYFSYAWGDETDERQAMCNDIYSKLSEMDWLDVHRDKNSMELGDSIDEFERNIGRGDFIVLLVSEKSLQSEHCMKELGLIYSRCQGQQKEFVSKVIPVVLADAKIGNLMDRLEIVEFWTEHLTKLDSMIKKLEQ